MTETPAIPTMFNRAYHTHLSHLLLLIAPSPTDISDISRFQLLSQQHRTLNFFSYPITPPPQVSINPTLSLLNDFNPSTPRTHFRTFHLIAIIRIGFSYHIRSLPAEPISRFCTRHPSIIHQSFAFVLRRALEESKRLVSRSLSLSDHRQVSINAFHPVPEPFPLLALKLLSFVGEPLERFSVNYDPKSAPVTDTAPPILFTLLPSAKRVLICVDVAFFHVIIQEERAIVQNAQRRSE